MMGETDQMIPLQDADTPDQGAALAKVWSGYVEGRPIKLHELLATFPYAGKIDRDRLTVKVAVAVARTWTIDNAMPAILFLGAVRGLDITLDLRDYGVLHQEVLDPGSGLYDSQFDYLVLLWQLNDFLPDMHACWGWSPEERADRITTAAQYAALLMKTAAERHKGTVICFDFGMDPHGPSRGVIDSLDAHSPSAVHRCLNEALHEEVIRMNVVGVHILRLAKLQYRLGFDHWPDDRLRLTARCPVGLAGQIAVLDEVVRLIATEERKPRKVLLLDCDNTLWGSVVGEDGWDGIRLDADYPGNAFVEIQKLILQLHHQGVVLGVCSKNDEAVVRSLFEEHPNMILRPEHISVWAVNWEPKSENIRSVVDRLSLSMDSFVFIDDSSVERAEIRARCPDVFVPEVPENPLQLLAFWQRFNPFARTSLSDEDRWRGRSYQQEEKRQTVRASAMSLTDFYADLQMRCRMWRAEEQDVPRIVQMSHRTNQFNATTIRMSEADVGLLLADSAVDVYLLELLDRFGASGVIGCAVVRRTAREATVEQFMLSCRVLKRTVENHFVGLIMSEVVGVADRLTLRYVPTKKNGLIRRFFDQIVSGESAAVQCEWHMDVTSENADNHLQPWIAVYTEDEEQ